MATKSEFSIVGLAHKVCLSAESAGYNPDRLNALAERPDLFKGVLQVQLGYAEIKPIEHVVNGDADPFTPEGWSVESNGHQKSGPMKLKRRGLHLYVNSKKVILFTSEKQQGGKWVRGHELREELSSKKVLNANVLDYLLAHPEFIPDEWKKKMVFFWGTVYRDSDRHLCVRCLSWSGGRWYGCDGQLDDGWLGDHPAALRAS